MGRGSYAALTFLRQIWRNLRITARRWSDLGLEKYPQQAKKTQFVFDSSKYRGMLGNIATIHIAISSNLGVSNTVAGLQVLDARSENICTIIHCHCSRDQGEGEKEELNVIDQS